MNFSPNNITCKIVNVNFLFTRPFFFFVSVENFASLRPKAVYSQQQYFSTVFVTAPSGH